MLRFRARRCRQLLICGVLTSVCLRVGAAEAPVATPVVPTGQRTTVVAAPPADDFIFVTGAGYEGAIVPASSPWSRMAEVTLRREPVPGVAVTPWTPAAADVAVAERIVTDFAAKAANESSLLGEQLRSTRDREFSAARARELPALLPTLKRHYFGLSYGDNRRIVVQMFPASVANWRSQSVFIMDGGCANSSWEVDVTARRLLRWVCAAFA